MICLSFTTWSIQRDKTLLDKNKQTSHCLELSNQNSTPSDIHLVGAANKPQTSFCVGSSTETERSRKKASRSLKYYKIASSDTREPYLFSQPLFYTAASKAQSAATNIREIREKLIFCSFRNSCFLFVPARGRLSARQMVARCFFDVHVVFYFYCDRKTMDSSVICSFFALGVSSAGAERLRGCSIRGETHSSERAAVNLIARPVAPETIARSQECGRSHLSRVRPRYGG